MKIYPNEIGIACFIEVVFGKKARDKYLKYLTWKLSYDELLGVYRNETP